MLQKSSVKRFWSAHSMCTTYKLPQCKECVSPCLQFKHVTRALVFTNPIQFLNCNHKKTETMLLLEWKGQTRNTFTENEVRERRFFFFLERVGKRKQGDKGKQVNIKFQDSNPKRKNSQARTLESINDT